MSPLSLHCQIGLALLASSLAGCSEKKQLTSDSPKPNFAYEGATAFPYLATEAKRQRLLESYSAVQNGATIEDVERLAGEPDIARARARKEKPDVIGYLRRYYVFKLSRSAVYMKDVHVSFYFDKDGRLYDRVPARKEELEARIANLKSRE